MENLKVIKNRIKTVDSIAKATNAMKLVSTIKLAKMNNLKKHSSECADILSDMFLRAEKEITFRQLFDEEQWFQRKSGERLILVISTDQGFCGPFNQLILKKSKEVIDKYQGTYVEVFGKKASCLKQRRAEENISRSVSSRYNIEEFASMLSQLTFKYIRDYSVSDVLVISGECKGVAVQKAKCLQIFPVEKRDISDCEYTMIEGEKLEFMNAVFQMYLSKLFFGIVSEHLLSELSAKVMAMDNSVRNANGISDKLGVLYNRIRQAKITQELTEIVSSVECMQ
ncbi:MAG: F0F1 ATP synthase subunit gamma [Holosporales bacterium]|jgi:F-type H+-transporting ATPase subunit gamma|nr:F0F1 ATP synthase subunit gamma [Holosporales bacterium]